MKGRGQNTEQESSVVQVDTLIVKVSLIYSLDLPFDVMRDDGVEVEVQIVAVIAKETQSFCFGRQIRGEVDFHGVLSQCRMVTCNGVELLAK